MTLFGFSLVLAAAFCHAIWNFFIKKINGGPELVWLFSALSALIYLPFAVFIIIVQKPVFGVWEVTFIAGSAVLHLGYFLLLQQGYKRGDLSLVYPIARASGPMLSAGFAFAFLGEHLTLQAALGAAIVITGVLFLTGGFGKGVRQARLSLAFGLGVGAFIGSYTVWDAYAVSALMVPPLLVDYASSVGRTVLLSPYALVRQRPALKMEWQVNRGLILINGFLVLFTYMMILFAFRLSKVSYVVAAREVSIVFSALLGILWLKEAHAPQKIAGAALIALGVVFIGMSK